MLAFTGVFLAGMLAGGAMTMRLDHRPPRFGGRLPPPPNFLPRIMERLTEQLELTPAQQAKIEPMIAQAQTDFQQLRRAHVKDVSQLIDRMHGEVAALLTPEQQVKLAKMREEFRARAERMRREFRGGGEPPGPPGMGFGLEPPGPPPGDEGPGPDGSHRPPESAEPPPSK